MHQSFSSCPHTHSSQPPTKQRHLLVALILILSFATIEALVGLASHSLVLVADAGHMVSDGAALGLAWLAVWLAHRATAQAKHAASPRWETWAALVNGLAVSAIALWIGWEALQRFVTPPEQIASMPMLVTAALGAGVNGINVALLHQSSHHDLNLRAAFLHILADALSCIGVLLAAIVVAKWHWLWADGAISFFVAGLILYGSVPLIWQTSQQLLTKESGLE